MDGRQEICPAVRTRLATSISSRFVGQFFGKVAQGSVKIRQKSSRELSIGTCTAVATENFQSFPYYRGAADLIK
jgi:hypothetical protein